MDDHEHTVGKRAIFLLGGTREISVLRDNQTIESVVEHHLQEYMTVPFFWEFEAKEVPSLLNCVELIAIEELEFFGFEV